MVLGTAFVRYYSFCLHAFSIQCMWILNILMRNRDEYKLKWYRKEIDLNSLNMQVIKEYIDFDACSAIEIVYGIYDARSYLVTHLVLLFGLLNICYVQDLSEQIILWDVRLILFNSFVITLHLSKIVYIFYRSLKSALASERSC